MRRPPISSFRCTARRFRSDARGGVAIIFGLSIVPLALAAGAAVDYTRAVNVRMALQHAVDSAALAGAAAYTSAAGATAASTLAANFVTNAANGLSGKATIAAPATTPGTVLFQGAVAAYTMQVTVTAQVPATLLSFKTGTVPVTVTATARNPVMKAQIDLSSWSSDACDANSLYWYPVPADGSLPPSSSMTLLFTNTATNPPTASINVAGTQKIGFAFKNVTGGKCGYGRNGYGGSQGSTHWFYSHKAPPNGSAYGSTASKNCSLQVAQGTLVNNVMTFPAPSKKCTTSSSTPTMASTLAHASPSCADIIGKTLKFQWNDMGGSSDDTDYDDGVYQYSCSGGAAALAGLTPGVVLIK